MRTLAAAAAFLLAIIGANYATSTWGLVPVGFGLMATAGTYLAGLTFVLRDTLQQQAGRLPVVGLIVAGAGLSYLLSDPRIAVASGVAFLVSELADQAVYTPLRRRGYVRAAVASNVVGAVVDTVLFLTIADIPGVPLWPSVPGQMVGKLAATGMALIVIGAVVIWRRAVLRESLHS
jgi:uncharacterized PurR-regulated membrane protein YhhQ (DUF165 family)